MHLRDSLGPTEVHFTGPLNITAVSLGLFSRVSSLREKAEPRKAMCVPSVIASERISIQDKASSVSSFLCPQITETTFMMASYMNHCSATVNLPTKLPAARQPRDLDGKFFPSVSCTKGPALL